MNWIQFISKKVSITSALFFAKNYLSKIDNPLLESEILLAEVFHSDRVFLKKNPKNFLNFLQKVRFFYFLFLRKRNTPVAYIVGYKNWRDLKISVNKHTLIPRDETEILCEHIFSQEFFPEKILDIGTGSGCISIACAKQYPKAHIQGIDISKKALLVAEENKKLLGANNVEFFQSNLLKEIQKNSHFNLIIANLPYVPTTEIVSLEVQKEPSSAIFSGKSGLVHIKRLANEIQDKKISFDQLWLEFLPHQYINIQNIFFGYKVSEFKDVSGQIFFACIETQ